MQLDDLLLDFLVPNIEHYSHIDQQTQPIPHLILYLLLFASIVQMRTYHKDEHSCDKVPKQQKNHLLHLAF